MTRENAVPSVPTPDHGTVGHTENVSIKFLALQVLQKKATSQAKKAIEIPSVTPQPSSNQDVPDACPGVPVYEGGTVGTPCGVSGNRDLWQPICPAAHPRTGEDGTLVRHATGRLALDVGRCLLTLEQTWAMDKAGRWIQ